MAQETEQLNPNANPAWVPKATFSLKKEEKQIERVKSQSRIDALLLPAIPRSLRGSAYSKDRCSFDSFDSLYYC